MGNVVCGTWTERRYPLENCTPFVGTTYLELELGQLNLLHRGKTVSDDDSSRRPPPSVYPIIIRSKFCSGVRLQSTEQV